jgi:hypothetical protein
VCVKRERERGREREREREREGEGKREREREYKSKITEMRNIIENQERVIEEKTLEMFY